MLANNLSQYNKFQCDLTILLAKQFNVFLTANPYELYLVDDEDWTFSKDQQQDFILFRSDTRPPHKIFKTGFMPKEKTVGSGQSHAEKDIQVCMRQKTNKGDIDIDPMLGVSATEKATIAPYFPFDNMSNNALGKRYIYAFYVDKYFKAHEYDLQNHSKTTAKFKEVVCEQVPAKYVIGAFECEVISRSTVVKYRLIKESLAWNDSAIKETPNFEARKSAMQNEYDKLNKYHYLELTEEENSIRVRGNPITPKVASVYTSAETFSPRLTPS